MALITGAATDLVDRVGSRRDNPQRPHARVVTPVALLYVLAWVGGLFVAPAGPAPPDSAPAIRDYYVHRGTPALTQSLLIHGVAGLCLLVLAWSIPTWPRARPWVRVTGTLAAAMSLTQAGFAIAAVTNAASAAATTSRSLLTAIDHADAVKLVLLAGFVAAGSAGSGGVWLRRVGYVLVPLLLLGSAAFVLDDTGATPALNLVLTTSLPLLLVWATILAVIYRSDRGTRAIEPRGVLAARTRRGWPPLHRGGR